MLGGALQQSGCGVCRAAIPSGSHSSEGARPDGCACCLQTLWFCRKKIRLANITQAAAIALQQGHLNCCKLLNAYMSEAICHRELISAAKDHVRCYMFSGRHDARLHSQAVTVFQMTYEGHRDVMLPARCGAAGAQGCSGASWLVPAAWAAPFAWRFCQCLRVWRDTGAAPQLWNALKYATAFPVILLSAARASVAPADWCAAAAAIAAFPAGFSAPADFSAEPAVHIRTPPGPPFCARIWRFLGRESRRSLMH